MKSPSARCDGLAWDGTNLWFVDSSAQKIHVLNVKGTLAQVQRTYDTKMKSLGGIAFDHDSAWIVDNEGIRFCRFSPSIAQLSHVNNRFVSDLRIAPAQKIPGFFDSYTGSSTYPMNDVEVNEFSCQLVQNELTASWRIHFGEDLFSSAPSFAKYTLTVHGDGFATPMARVFEAVPGQNEVNNALLAKHLIAGTYKVSIFAFVQYRDKTGTTRILTKSTPTLVIAN